MELTETPCLIYRAVAGDPERRDRLHPEEHHGDVD
jgi:hypothetical protein